MRDYLEGLEERAIHLETEAFWRQHDNLLGRLLSLVNTWRCARAAWSTMTVIDHTVPMYGPTRGWLAPDLARSRC